MFDGFVITLAITVGALIGFAVGWLWDLPFEDEKKDAHQSKRAGERTVRRK